MDWGAVWAGVAALAAIAGVVHALMRHTEKDAEFHGKVKQALKDMGKPLDGNGE